jgi:type I restriction enzyme S subunit
MDSQDKLFFWSKNPDMFGVPVTNPKGWEKKALGDLIKVSSGKGLTAYQMGKDGQFPAYGGKPI